MAKAELGFHPEAKAFLEASRSLTDELAAPGLQLIEQLRRSMEEVAKISGHGGAKDYEGTREERVIDSSEVKGGIPVYVYTPKLVDLGSDGATILVYFHGGANIMGSRNYVDDTCKLLASQAACIVVNVEYRLAPEHKFPAMMNDAYTVVHWILANRSSIGGTPKSKVGVSGDSAGGQIAASVSHHISGVDFQILIYPWLSAGEPYLPSHKEFSNGPVVTLGFLEWVVGLQVEKKEDLLDPRFCILHNEKLDHLPPTLCIVAEFDPLRDESYEYSKRLIAAGVDCELFLAKGAIHGFFSIPGAFAELAGQSYAKTIEFINKVRRQH